MIDASHHIEAIAANCPNTKMVLGGYSQGAAVMGYTTVDAIPVGYAPPPDITGPMPAQVSNHVAAITLFGKPSSQFLSGVGAPPIVIGHLYTAKTDDLCAPGDPVCAPEGNNYIAHIMYSSNGMVGEAVAFTASRLV